ncbi:DUF4279 domain-containing protein [Snodgrassella sp. M0351]|uniref:DUF4279 domain-containing protein n=1 Tax=Snodgrassella sp. M0351 TaxID=2751012 RepID=UPI0018DC1B8C|nr:DUF4279 domain-containing protein [Snodgrassella sp. M0351]MBI0164384.1 DUF4279 domain-containing protein [Snodgrassella sp. M0351]
MLQAEVTIEFIICGPNFNPDSVTKLLGISPTTYTIRGSMRNCKFSPAIETTWCLRHSINSLNNLDHQVRQIINRIENKLNILLTFKEENDIDFIFTIYGHVYKNEKQSDINLKKNTLDFISDLGSKLTMDIEFW